MPRSLIAVLAAALASAAGLSVAAAEEKKGEPKLARTADEKAEKALLELLNKARAEKKLPPLRANPVLTKVARAHSANMAKQGKMSHELDGKNPAKRVLEAGYDYRSVGENVAWSERDGPVADVHAGWMKSKVHRDNILAAKFQEVGIGLAHSAKGEVYITQVFGTPRPKR
jgi:uncharacterized protein YkwD